MGNLCSSCFGDDPEETIHIGSNSQPRRHLSDEERRQAALEAAERRKMEEQSRGQKTSNPEFERLKHRQEKIDRAEEEVARAGGIGKPALSWQVS